MGELNHEAEVAQKKNRKGLKDVDASLRDQIPAKLLAKLLEDDIGEKIAKMWQIGNANRTTWLERQQIYLKDWDEFLVSTAEGPFAGSSNLHLPLPLIICKTIHARFMQALMGIDPPFLVKARTEANKDRSELIVGLIRYVLMEYCNNQAGIEEAVDGWLWDWISVGSGLIKNRWDCTYEKFMDVEMQTEPGPPVYSTGPDGKQRMQQIPVKKEVEVEKTIKKFEGSIFELRNHEDVLLIGGKGDPQMADGVIDRYFMTASDIWTLVDRKIFDEDAAREVIKSGRDHENSTTIGGNVKLQRANDAGKAVRVSAAELDKFEILETYLSYDVDGNGINSEIVVWVHCMSRRVLRANYLRRMIKSGERPFFKIDYHKRRDADYGIGIPEMMHPLSVEADAMHNMRIDFGLISVAPWGFYRPTSNLQPETISLTPGSLIPLDNPQQDVYFPNLGNRTAWGFQEESALYTMIERLSSINDINQAVMSGSQGPTRTATGTRALLGESNANLDVHLRRLNRGWKKLLQFLFHQLQQRLPDGFQFRILGDDGNDYWGQIKDREYIAGDFDFEVVPNSSQSNPMIQEETAQALVQMTQNPLDIQLGIIGPAQRYEAIRNWFKAKQIKDYARYIQKPKDYTYLPTPEEEANRVLAGIEVPVTMQSDHQGFMDYFKHIMSTPEVLGQFPKDMVVALAVQNKKHEDMLASLKQMQAQQNNQAQMNINQGQGPVQSMQQPGLGGGMGQPAQNGGESMGGPASTPPQRGAPAPMPSSAQATQ